MVRSSLNTNDFGRRRYSGALNKRKENGRQLERKSKSASAFDLHEPGHFCRRSPEYSRMVLCGRFCRQ